MAITRHPRNKRLIVTMQHQVYENDVIGAFLWQCSDFGEAQLRHTPPTRECLRILESVLWWRGINGMPSQDQVTPLQLDYATRCMKRVWGSRLVPTAEPRPVSRSDERG